MENKIQIITNQSQKELKKHGSYEFPLLVSDEMLARYASGSFLWHWHPEIEFTLITSGSMLYQINDETFYLQEGQALFGNSNTLHTGYMDSGKNCHYTSITFDAKLIYGYEGSILQTKYILPLIQDTNLSAIHFNLSEKWHYDVINHLELLQKLARCQDEFYELDIQMLLFQICKLILSNKKESLKSIKRNNEKHYERIKEMLFYVQQNYSSKIELKDIANHVNLCKSECCRVFKRYMKVSLFEYLLAFRVEKSLIYLISDYSVTEAALKVGFSEPNYYSKVFRKYIGCSPSKYKINEKR